MAEPWVPQGKREGVLKPQGGREERWVNDARREEAPPTTTEQ